MFRHSSRTPGRTIIDALVNPDEVARRAIADRHGLGATGAASLEGFSVRRPDLVILASPGFLHGRQARLAIEAGCHVLVEKPPADGASEARELASLASARGVKLGAVLNYRFRDLPLELKGHVDSGKLGAVTRVHIAHHDLRVRRCSLVVGRTTQSLPRAGSESISSICWCGFWAGRRSSSR